MHQWVGNLLTGAAAARCFTYLVLYLAPPTSTSPSRIPSEFVTSFCLMAAGIMLMASNRDTVDAMVEYDVNAMVAATVAMSMTAASMAWSMALVAVRQWAEKKEMQYKESVVPIRVR
ncbi:uncharacterized protein A1O9_12359 [Exophiala aquamarina CBS 119918]|uniref:Protein YTP1-like C-terminal domain-containing protein n=1 Tax=Exophiala aquamarina CBS 119918 TaxID=1182545 RepID=A0A072NV19_9EURO|nr:uncharacterized protein A1O9_12359 [Exophiala aquamarina CBS 119918]KEF51724.1 hypothetical protein A1O9_12359 [Exophiala aquamarina CBS 119918]